MLIDISKLKRSAGMAQNFTLEEPMNQESSGKDRLEFEGPVKAEVKAVNSNGRIVVNGSVLATIALQCSRCLEKYTRDMEVFFEREYRIDPAVEEDDDDIEVIKGENIDLSVPIRESILLELPMKQVCRDECKGLCNMCGINLNEGSCSCKREDIDPRLEELKKFFKS